MINLSPGYPDLSRINHLLYEPNLAPANYTAENSVPPNYLLESRWILLNYTQPECCQEYALLKTTTGDMLVMAQTRIALQNHPQACAPKLLFLSVELLSVVNQTVVLAKNGTELQFNLWNTAGRTVPEGNCRRSVLMDSLVSGGAVLISYEEVLKPSKEQSLVSHLIMVMWIIVLFFWLMHVGNYVWKVYDED